ncbi:MAG: glycerol-3-phosphate 1-O-acyltransferase PlsY [Oscillospiraceae bacterium]|nr:glycerol-3-phosphate 1-O-acyltransferase PlsY [Oscillospiraceae bacterium]
MTFWVKWIIIFVQAYLLGSLSFSIIVSKGIYKKDIRTFGSGNAGMTNVLRTFGKKAATLTITGDVLKGTTAVLVARLLFAGTQATMEANFAFNMFGREIYFSNNLYMEIGLYIAVLGAFLGHMFPVYFGFKGGKGVSVIAGSMIAVTPITLLTALMLFFIIVFSTKIVSLGSIIAPPTYIIWTLIQVYITQTVSVPNLIAAVVFPSAIIWSHRTNIKRLLNGTEYKFGQNKDKK